MKNKLYVIPEISALSVGALWLPSPDPSPRRRIARNRPHQLSNQ